MFSLFSCWFPVSYHSWNNFNFLEFSQVCFLSFHMILGTIMLLLIEIFSMSFNSFCSKIHFNAIISILAFCPDNLFTSDSEVLKSPAAILFSASPLRSLITFLIYFHAPMLEMYASFLIYWPCYQYIVTFVYHSCFQCHKISPNAVNLLPNCTVVILNVFSLYCLTHYSKILTTHHLIQTFVYFLAFHLEELLWTFLVQWVTSLNFFAQELAFAPPYLKDSVARYAILGWQMLSLNTLNMLFHCILACTICAESLVKEVPCKVLSHFSWLPFKFLVIDFPDFHFNVSGRRWPLVIEIRCIISFVDVYIQVLLYIFHVLSYYLFK